MPLPPLSDVEFILEDTGVVGTAGSITGIGILERPQQIIQDGMVITTEWKFLAKAAVFGTLLYDSGITIDNINFVVRENRILNDGVLCELSLEKVPEEIGLITDLLLDGGSPFTPDSVYGIDDTADGGAP